MADVVKEIADGILSFDRVSVNAKVEAALAAGIAPEIILNEGMIAAMGEVGRLFEEEEFFVPEMLLAAKTMQQGLAVLRPHLAESGVKPVGKMVVGTVKGDLHDIGKNLVGIMVEGGGFEVEDLGIDVPPERFVEAAMDEDVRIVGLSALLTATKPNMKDTIDALEEAGVRDRVKIIVGGAALTDAYAQEIGADGYAPDASRALKVARSLLG